MTNVIEIIVRGKDEASKVFGGIGKALDTNLGKTLTTVGLVGVGAVGAIGAAIGKLAYDSAQVEPVKITFDSLAESIGGTADSLLEKLRPATMGVLSDIDLMKSANKLMAMGLADSEEEAAKLANMAVTLGAAMGKDATGALEDFTLMLANQSIPRLDTFGISSGKVRDRIEELQEADESLTREQAFMIAAMEQGEETLAKVGDISGTGAVKIAGLKASFGNLSDAIGTTFAPALIGLLDNVLTPLANALTDLIPLLQTKVAGAFEALAPAFEALSERFQPVMEWIQEHSTEILTVLAGVIMTIMVPAFGALALSAGAAALSVVATLAPLIAIGAAIGAAVVLLRKAWEENWGGIQEKTQAVMDNVIRPLLDWLGGVFNWLKDTALPALGSAFSTVWGFIQEVVTAAWEGFKPHLEELQGVLRSFWEEIKPRLEEAWSAIQAAMQKVSDWVRDTLIPKLQELWDKLEPVREIVVKVAGAFGDFMGSAFINGLKAWLRAIIALWDGVSSAISTAIDWIQDVMDWIQRAIDAWHRLQDAMGGAGGGTPTGGSPLLQTGLAYVPRTMPAILHEGEAVLTRREAEIWRSQLNVHVGNVYGMDGFEEMLDHYFRQAARYAI